MILKIVPKPSEFCHSRKIAFICQGLKTCDKTVLKAILSVFKINFLALNFTKKQTRFK